MILSGLTSSSGGDDRLQVGMAVFAVVVSFMVTMMVPIVAPAYDTSTGYTYADMYAERASLEAFTGESMTNMAPWKLTGVYTTWTLGDSLDNIDPETGWAYGESIPYSQIGKTSQIKLDPAHKSDRPLHYNTYEGAIPEIVEQNWWAYRSDGSLTIFGQLADWIGLSTVTVVQEQQDVNSWQFSGYRYEFDPMLVIDYTNPDDPYSKESTTDAKLSLVWYKGDQIGQGLSGGLILYSNTTNGVVANITMDQILSSYNSVSSYSTKYKFDFQGVQLYLNLRFDLDVITGAQDLNQAFDEGRWTIAITALSMDNWMNFTQSNSLSNSTANLLDTYIQIFTLSFPTVDFFWSIVLWVICILPVQLVVLMFASRFGIAGLAVGALGSAIITAIGFAA